MSEIQCAIPKNQNLLKQQYLKFKVATYSGTILYELGILLLTGPPAKLSYSPDRRQHQSVHFEDTHPSSSLRAGCNRQLSRSNFRPCRDSIAGATELFQSLIN